MVRKNNLFIDKYHHCLFTQNNGDTHVPTVSPEILNQYSNKLMMCWFRNNTYDAMDDFFPLKIFSPSVLQDLTQRINSGTSQDKQNVDVLIAFILPMCCLNCVLRSKDGDRYILQKWAYVGMYILLFYRLRIKVEGREKYKKRKF